MLDLVPAPEGNKKEHVQKYEKLFQEPLPQLPENKQFKDDEEKERIRKMWPPGHDAGMKRLEDFLNNKVSSIFDKGHVVVPALTFTTDRQLRSRPLRTSQRPIIQNVSILLLRTR